MASDSSETNAAYRDDVRFQHLFDMLRRLESKLKSPYTHKLLTDDKRDLEKARQALTSIGLQLEASYPTQLGLLEDVPSKKAVVTEWQSRKPRLSAGKSSGSGKKPIDPLRS